MDRIQEEQEQTPSQDLMAHRHHFGRGHLTCLYFQKGLIGLTMSQLSAKDPRNQEHCLHAGATRSCHPWSCGFRGMTVRRMKE